MAIDEKNAEIARIEEEQRIQALKDEEERQKLIEELNQTETKQKFIKKELTELQKKIAIEHQNMKQAKTKAAEKRKKEASLLETKKELMTPKINKT